MLKRTWLDDLTAQGRSPRVALGGAVRLIVFCSVLWTVVLLWVPYVIFKLVGYRLDPLDVSEWAEPVSLVAILGAINGISFCMVAWLLARRVGHSPSGLLLVVINSLCSAPSVLAALNARGTWLEPQFPASYLIVLPVLAGFVVGGAYALVLRAATPS